MASTTSGASVIAGAVAEANGTEVPLTKRSGPVTLVRLVVSGNAIAVSFASDGAAGVAIVDIRDEVLQIGKKAAEANETKCSAIRVDVIEEADVEGPWPTLLLSLAGLITTPTLPESLDLARRLSTKMWRIS